MISKQRPKHSVLVQSIDLGDYVVKVMKKVTSNKDYMKNYWNVERVILLDGKPFKLTNKDINNAKRSEILKYLKDRNLCIRCSRKNMSPYSLCRICRKKKMDERHGKIKH